MISAKRIGNKLRALWTRLVHENASPHQIALGFAIGLFATFYPIPVVDTAVALVFAWMVGANKSACLIGNNFILLIYPVIPLLLGAEFFAGKVLLGAPIELHAPSQWNLPAIVRESRPHLHALILGGLVLGIPSSILGYIGVRRATAQWQGKHLPKASPPNDSVMD